MSTPLTSTSTPCRPSRTRTSTATTSAPRKPLCTAGAERTRVSSQSWKRAVRHEIERRLGDPAVRTRRLIEAITERLVAQGWDSGPRAGRRTAGDAVRRQGRHQGRGRQGTPRRSRSTSPRPQSMNWPPSWPGTVTRSRPRPGRRSHPRCCRRTRVEAVLRSRNGTIQLLGRMLAELPGAEVDGAVQFAHAFTTHATVVETDFFTAVDDIEKLGDAGSAHMNAGQFSAGTFYRYANIGLETLAANLERRHRDRPRAGHRVPARVRHHRPVRQAERDRRHDHPRPGVHRCPRGPADLAGPRVRRPSPRASSATRQPSQRGAQRLRRPAARVLGQPTASPGTATRAITDKPASGLGDRVASLTTLIRQRGRRGARIPGQHDRHRAAAGRAAAELGRAQHFHRT